MHAIPDNSLGRGNMSKWILVLAIFPLRQVTSVVGEERLSTPKEVATKRAGRVLK